MNKPKVIVTRRWPDEVEALLREKFDAVLNRDDAAMSPAQLQDAMREADALLPTVTDQINAEVLSTPDKCARIIASEIVPMLEAVGQPDPGEHRGGAAHALGRRHAGVAERERHERFGGADGPRRSRGHLPLRLAGRG